MVLAQDNSGSAGHKSEWIEREYEFWDDNSSITANWQCGSYDLFWYSGYPRTMFPGCVGGFLRSPYFTVQTFSLEKNEKVSADHEGFWWIKPLGVTSNSNFLQKWYQYSVSLRAPDFGSAAGSSWSQDMTAQDLQGIRANCLSEKTNFGAKIALS